jgi:RNA polymerase sigma factor (sigma-70 family)
MPASPLVELEQQLQAVRGEILQYAHRVLHSWDDAEDAVQMAQVKAWRARARFRPGDFRPWLFLMTKWACADVLRGAAYDKRRLEVVDSERWSEEVSEHFIDPGPTPEEALLSGCLAAEFQDAIARLPGEGMRRAVSLVYLHGLMVDEAARRMGITPHAVSMHTWKARRLLKAALSRETGPGSSVEAQGIASGPQDGVSYPPAKNAIGAAS